MIVSKADPLALVQLLVPYASCPSPRRAVVKWGRAKRDRAKREKAMWERVKWEGQVGQG